MFEALLALVLGVVFTAVVFGAMFWFCWFMALIFVGWSDAPKIAAGVTGLFFLVACFSAWRKSDPLANLEPLAPGEPLGWNATMVAAHGLGVPILTRRSLAGLGAVLLGGPANLFDAIDVWRHRLPRCDVRIAHRLLMDCRGGLNLESIQDHTAMLVLYRLQLIRVRHGDATLQAHPTAKGDAILDDREM